MTIEPTTAAAEPVITIKAKSRDAIPVDMAGVRYSLNPPKAALAMKLAVRAKTAGDDPTLVLEAVDEWLDKAFGKREANKVRKRLDDADDPLDTPDIMELMEAVIERASGNPTT
jgi:hypothetical protein